MFADAPPWFSQFVRDEVRPLLVQHRHVALDAWVRWLGDHEERQRGLKAWKARRQKFLKKLAARPAEKRHRKTPPAKAMAWISGNAELSARETKTGITTTATRACGWGPRELGEYSGPPVDEFPLPPPSDRDLTVDECWTGLLALHDVARVPRERLGPAENIAFNILRGHALKLEQGVLPELRGMMKTATASLHVDANADAVPGSSTLTRAPDSHPDGVEGGRWLWWKNAQCKVPKGTVYRLLKYMWGRDFGSYDELDTEVFDSPVAPSTVRSYANKANNALPCGFPWRLSADSVSRQLAKVLAPKGA